MVYLQHVSFLDNQNHTGAGRALLPIWTLFSCQSAQEIVRYQATQGAENQAQQQGQEQQETQQQDQSQVGVPDYEKQIAERDEKIAALEAQVAEAAKNAETAEQLRGEIAELKA